MSKNYLIISVSFAILLLSGCDNSQESYLDQLNNVNVEEYAINEVVSGSTGQISSSYEDDRVISSKELQSIVTKLKNANVTNYEKINGSDCFDSDRYNVCFKDNLIVKYRSQFGPEIIKWEMIMDPVELKKAKSTVDVNFGWKLRGGGHGYGVVEDFYIENIGTSKIGSIKVDFRAIDLNTGHYATFREDGFLAKDLEPGVGYKRTEFELYETSHARKNLNVTMVISFSSPYPGEIRDSKIAFISYRS